MCLMPIPMYRTVGGRLTLNPVAADRIGVDPVYVSCGRCVECQSRKSNEWAFRIWCEAQQYDPSRVLALTLTYKTSSGCLNKKDYQSFFKRLRQSYGSFRYFISGEYGSRFGREHFHVVLFGVSMPADIVYKYTKNDIHHFWSDEMNDLWGHGLVDLSFYSFNGTKYFAKYMQKELNTLFPKVVPPFIQMSLKPGLGTQYVLDNADKLLASGKLYLNGKYISLPRYFLMILDRAGYDTSHLRAVRFNKPPNVEATKKRRDAFYKKMLDR